MVKSIFLIHNVILRHVSVCFIKYNHINLSTIFEWFQYFCANFFKIKKKKVIIFNNLYKLIFTSIVNKLYLYFFVIVVAIIVFVLKTKPIKFVSIWTCFFISNRLKFEFLIFCFSVLFCNVFLYTITLYTGTRMSRVEAFKNHAYFCTQRFLLTVIIN